MVAMIALGTLAALAPRVGAAVLTYPDGAPAEPYQAWADAAHVPTPVHATVINESCPANPHRPACVTDGANGEMFVFLDPDGLRPLGRRLERQAVYHELGHVFDRQVLTWPYRSAFERLLGDARPWRTGSGNSPHEQFAEAFGWCGLGAPPPLAIGNSHRRQGAYGYVVTRRTHRRVCALIARAARTPASRRTAAGSWP
jgi:hypothetical protein